MATRRKYTKAQPPAASPDAGQETTRAASAGPQPITGDTTAATHQRSPRLSAAEMPQPVSQIQHEIDESAGNQARAPRKIMKQAALDLARGLVDTDRGPPSDKIYREQKK